MVKKKNRSVRNEFIHSTVFTKCQYALGTALSAKDIITKQKKFVHQWKKIGYFIMNGITQKS